MTYAIETVNLSKTYNGEVEALKSLNLVVDEGESIGYIGPNGAGKTTTIQILLNLIRPTKGQAFLFGQQMLGQERAVLRNVGTLVEIPGYYEYLTPNDILQYICKIYRMDREEIQDNIDQVLKTLQIEHVKNKKIETFSTGMKRRLGIGSALVHDPDLLILDEPTIGLDPKGVREVRDLVKQLNNEGKTVFLTSHNLTEVTEITERVVFLRDGEIVKDIQMADLETQLSAKQIDLKFLKDLTKEQQMFIENLENVEYVNFGKVTQVSYQGGLEQTSHLLEQMVNEGLPLFSFTPRSMTLEDLYLDLYGRATLEEGNAL